MNSNDNSVYKMCDLQLQNDFQNPYNITLLQNK